jgi:EAL domain-containing protein (putative c-di-GMP-specific phosphodiesterase class I)
VLRTACEQLVLWRQQWPTLTVAVNVSHSELLDPGFAPYVARILAESGLPGRALHLEITETVLVADDDIGRVLATLAALKVEFAIDDFGTGQSSLSRLRDLPARRSRSTGPSSAKSAATTRRRSSPRSSTWRTASDVSP